MTLVPSPGRRRLTTLAFLTILLAPLLAGCSGQQANAAAIATALQPAENGFSFANFPSSSFPAINFNERDLVEMFGAEGGLCVDGIWDQGVLTAEAAAGSQMINQDGASGNAVGLAVIWDLR